MQQIAFPLGTEIRLANWMLGNSQRYKLQSGYLLGMDVLLIKRGRGVGTCPVISIFCFLMDYTQEQKNRLIETLYLKMVNIEKNTQLSKQSWVGRQNGVRKLSFLGKIERKVRM